MSKVRYEYDSMLEREVTPQVLAQRELDGWENLGTSRSSRDGIVFRRFRRAK